MTSVNSIIKYWSVHNVPDALQVDEEGIFNGHDGKASLYKYKYNGWKSNPRMEISMQWSEPTSESKRGFIIRNNKLGNDIAIFSTKAVV